MWYKCSFGIYEDDYLAFLRIWYITIHWHVKRFPTLFYHWNHGVTWVVSLCGIQSVNISFRISAFMEVWISIECSFWEQPRLSIINQTQAGSSRWYGKLYVLLLSSESWNRNQLFFKDLKILLANFSVLSQVVALHFIHAYEAVSFPVFSFAQKIVSFI